MFTEQWSAGHIPTFRVFFDTIAAATKEGVINENDISGIKSAKTQMELLKQILVPDDSGKALTIDLMDKSYQQWRSQQTTRVSKQEGKETKTESSNIFFKMFEGNDGKFDTKLFKYIVTAVPKYEYQSLDYLKKQYREYVNTHGIELDPATEYALSLPTNCFMDFEDEMKYDPVVGGFLHSAPSGVWYKTADHAHYAVHRIGLKGIVSKSVEPFHGDSISHKVIFSFQDHETGHVSSVLIELEEHYSGDNNYQLLEPIKDAIHVDALPDFVMLNTALSMSRNEYLDYRTYSNRHTLDERIKRLDVEGKTALYRFIDYVYNVGASTIRSNSDMRNVFKFFNVSLEFNLIPKVVKNDWIPWQFDTGSGSSVLPSCRCSRCHPDDEEDDDDPYSKVGMY